MSALEAINVSAPSNPVHVDAKLDAHLSRWLWLVKWLLVIPHYFVLAFLWLAFVVLSAAAMVAIVVTGRYPRGIFDFNVGVLRWTWRVAYYAYGALGTDRYPPFTLDEVPDYPTHLTVEYPEHLSRGLVLVKWWLLAIPHYLIVALLVGSGVYVVWDTSQDPDRIAWGGGLIGVLVLVAAVVLLFTGKYPQQIFDLVLGLNRWVLRVAAYAGLMTDEYPPFRLDMGGGDPGAAAVAVPAAPAAAPAAAPGVRPQPWSTGRIVTMVLAILAFLTAGGLLTGGTTLAVADQTLRNDQGFLMSPMQAVSTQTYALATEPLTIEGAASDTVPEALLGDISVRARSVGGEEIFVGVAPAASVDRYLADVEHSTLVALDDVDGTLVPRYEEVPGGAPAVGPGERDIWVASSTGAGEHQLSWAPESGEWTLVVMNADSTEGVSADLSVGAEAPVLGWVAIGLLAGGGLLLLLSIALVLGVLYGGRRTTP